MFLEERFGPEEPPTRGLSYDRASPATVILARSMGSSVVVRGVLASLAPGEAKPLPTLRQSVSEVVISSEAAKPWPPPGAARNSMTLLPGETSIEQIRTRGNHHAKPSASSSVLVVAATAAAAAAAAADASLLSGEAESATTKEAAVPPWVGDAANNGSALLLQCQSSPKEVPTVSINSNRATAVDTRYGGARCCEESKGDTQRREGSVPLPLGASNHMVVVHGSISTSQSIEVVRTEDEHAGRPNTVEPNLVAPINDSAKHCTTNASEGQAVDAREGVGTDAGEGDLEHSVSLDEQPPRPRSSHVAGEASGSAAILPTGACIDGEIESPSTTAAGRISAPATPSGTEMDVSIAEIDVPIAEIDVFEVGAQLETSNEVGMGEDSIADGGVPEPEIPPAEDDNAPSTEGNGTEEAPVALEPSQERYHPPALEADGVHGSTKADPNTVEVFFPSETFDCAKHGYVFRLGDKGLGFYVEGYVDRRTKAKRVPLHRPWNAGPGDEVVRRGPIGPVHRPFKIIKTRPRKGKNDAEEPDMRPLTARLAAQRDARVFQSTLSNREQAVDAHTLALVTKLSNPAFLKDNNSCGGHEQTLIKDGEKDVTTKSEKKEEDRAKLLWYHKVYEDHLRSQFLSKRSGENTENRRVAHAASRRFAAELSERENELDSSIVQATKDHTKLEFLKAEYSYPGAYASDGRLITEEGGPVSNELHRTEEQKERIRSYGFKARQRFRTAHDDLVDAISKKDEDLHNALKNTDPATLQDFEEKTVSSSGGVGIYRQKERVGGESSPRRQSPSIARQKKSPEQLRDKFAQSLEAQVRSKDNALMEKVAGLDEEETNQVVDDLGKGARCLPDSWRQNPDSFRKIQKHRNQLVAEIAADRQKVVCPWRPGGKHIAHEPWQALIPRDHRPPVRSASEKKGGHINGENEGLKAQEGGGQCPNRGSAGGGKDGGERPHTAPARRRKPFIDIIGPNAKRLLAAQPPDTGLHKIFCSYSNEPLPRFETALRPAWQSVQAPRNPGACADTDTALQESPRGTDHEKKQRVWSARIDPSTHGRTLPSSNTKRPHSAAPKTHGRFRAPSQRPSTASGATKAAPEGMDGLDVRHYEDIAPEQEEECLRQPLQACNNQSLHECSSQSLALDVPSGPGVTVLWARLCKPSSALTYKRSAWPARPRRPGPSHNLSRRRGKALRKVPTDKQSGKVATGKISRKVRTETVGVANVAPTGRNDVRGLEAAVCSTPVEVECMCEGDVKRLSGRGEGGAAPLEELEDRLLVSSWRRIHQRHRVFRGYAERSRRSRVWDPESPVYAKEDSKGHHSANPRSRDAARPRPYNIGWNEGKERSGTLTKTLPGEGYSTRDRNHKTRNRRKRLAADADHPLEMDWKEVDTRRAREVADEIETSLEGKLFAAVTGNLTAEHRLHCFREAQRLVVSAGALLGCPKEERERFAKEYVDDLQSRHYAATVTRLSILWAALCGVIEIVGMLQRRKELLEVFRSERHQFDEQNEKGASASGGDNTAGLEEDCPATPTSMTALSSITEVTPVENIRTRQYIKRLELAEISTAIAESLKIWLGIVPWPVKVLYGGEKLVSSLAAEEEALPLPADSLPSTDPVDVRVEVVPRGGGGIIVV